MYVLALMPYTFQILSMRTGLTHLNQLRGSGGFQMVLDVRLHVQLMHLDVGNFLKEFKYFILFLVYLF